MIRSPSFLLALVLLATPTIRAVDSSSDGTLRFAIICDRTGGMRPGVFERAVEKINSLDPEFVMSVGDLIDGYTDSPAVWTAQWDELDAIIKNFKAPFHAVVGNHDISNPKMREAWVQRRGATHYAFVRKNALFLVLDSEDIEGGGFGAEQIAFARNALSKHSEVRWTFVFFHRPLWLQNGSSFDQVAESLQGRSYTVFTGHLHHYISARRRGMEHYVLATSGGDSGLRGEDMGEFDHVTTVTLRPGGRPEILNHAVDGARTMPPGVLTEQFEGRAASLRNGSWLEVAPVLLGSEDFSRLEIPVTLRNPEPSPLKVTGALVAQAGLQFKPETISATVLPGESKTIPIVALSSRSEVPKQDKGKAVTAQLPLPNAQYHGGQSAHAINESGPAIRLTGSYEMQSGPVSISASRPIMIDWEHRVPLATGPVTFPGPLNVKEWPPALFTRVTRPLYIKESWDWHGPEDGVFSFAVQRHGNLLHIAVITEDDRVVTAANAKGLQDRIIVVLRTSGATATLEATVGERSGNACCELREKSVGMMAQFALKLSPEESTFHLNIGWVDVDRPENAKPSVLWWRPPTLSGFGQFSIND